MEGPAAVRRTYDELMDTAARRAKGAAIDGVLVCEMAEPGVECVVGVSRDELFGPVVMFGLGGVFVEVLGDVAFRVPPFDKAEALRHDRSRPRGPRCSPASGAGRRPRCPPWST